MLSIYTRHAITSFMNSMRDSKASRVARWRQRHTKDVDPAQILAEARRHYAQGAALESTDLPQHGNRWGELQVRMEKRINSFQTCEEAVEFAQTWGGFDHRVAYMNFSGFSRMARVELIQTLAKHHYHEFEQFVNLFDDGLFSTQLSNHSTRTVQGLRRTSEVLYWQIGHVLNVVRNFPEVESIVEIGGGYGNTARLWLSNPVRRIRRYAICDLPESLFFAEIFLRLNFPNLDLHYLADGAAGSQVGEEQQVILCPLGAAQAMNEIPFDGVLNSGSLGEVSEEWTRFWSDWMDRQPCRFFYSLNNFAVPIDELQDSRNVFSPVLSHRWSLREISNDNPIVKLQARPNTCVPALTFVKDAEAPPKPTPEAFNLIRNEVLTRENYIRWSYMLHWHPDPDLVLQFVDKAIADLGYVPKELMHLVSGALSAGPSTPETTAALSTHFEKMRKVYEESFPNVA